MDFVYFEWQSLKMHFFTRVFSHFSALCELNQLILLISDSKRFAILGFFHLVCLHSIKTFHSIIVESDKDAVLLVCLSMCCIVVANCSPFCFHCFYYVLASLVA